MPILEDPMINRDECDFSKFEEWFKTVETHQSSEWFDTDLQPELTDSDTSSYFYPNSSDNVFSDNSPLDSSTSSSELGSIEQNNFLFNEDLPSKNLQFTSSYPFDSFGFSKSVEDIRIDQLLLKNNEQSRQKPIKTKPVKAGKNQLGGCYLNGRPLPTTKRLQIIELSNQGVKPCMISRTLKVSHGCVSKILSKFQKTGLFSAGKIGGSKPKKSIPQVISAIETYKKLRPNIFSWEIREQLVNDGICKADNILSISSINRIIRTKLNNCSPASTPNQTV